MLIIFNKKYYLLFFKKLFDIDLVVHSQAIEISRY